MTDAATDHAPEIDRLREISERLVSPELAVRVIEALPDALVVVSDDGKIVVFNAQAELLFGYARIEVMGRPIETLIPEALRGGHVAHREGFVRDPRVRPMGIGMTLAGRKKSGEEFPVQINLSPIVTTDGIFVCAVARKVREATPPK